MRLLITGSNGFLGSKFVKAYKNNYDLITLSRVNADICNDLTSNESLEEIVADFVIHSAGKAHVIPKTKLEEKEFYDVNVNGTQKLINSLNGVKSFVFISTVAVYGLDIGEDINESYELLGKTPYAKSKIKAEKLLINWSKKNNIKLLILRLPLLAAENPPGNLGSMIDAIKNNRYFSINKGQSKRSVVLIEDIVNWLPNQFGKNGIYNLTDNYNPTFRELEDLICCQLNKNKPFSIPHFIACLIGKVGDYFNLSIINSNKIDKMRKDLTFSTKKAMNELDWKPTLVINGFKIT